MQFLITGGAGFIGSHLTDKLLLDGHHVVVIDNLSTGNRRNLPNHPRLRFIEKNILDCKPEDFSEKFDAIAHLAATASVPSSWLYPLDTHENNLSATVWVIELCQKLSIPRLVYTSSAAIYGEQTELPITENHLPNPIAPYGWQKLFSEQYAYLFSQRFGFSFIGLRLFNVFGPRQIPDSSYSGVISIFVNAMQQNQSITIYGDGEQTRDFVYVQDVATALSDALTKPLNSNFYSICNIGTGISTSLVELVDIVSKCFPNWSGSIKLEPARFGDIRRSQSDITRAYDILGFVPKISIQSGIEHLVRSLND
ncbi:NAD-dependent epimerase/dehydratase family protein [Pseudanabaena mucicola]|jgi:UDP-glucose 4-epimerase|uniref:NAD-dependent epimerase/dehydratase family protein n=1 Tax=Pseudanabaena mucicola TaxID=71190 RepID=UPI0025765EA6|nr:NAD-dependent epimerase/dehydratase family protein [Pseudanabaena mucicola]